VKLRRPVTLRVKLALVALVLLALPYAGYLYVREMERFLLSAQEATLVATARAVATVLHDRPALLGFRPREESDLRREAEEELQRLTGGEPIAEDAAHAPGGPAYDEIAAILKGLERANSRIWVVNRTYRVLALTGSLKRGDLPEARALQRSLAWLLSLPTEDFDDAIADNAIAAGREITAALAGVTATRTRNTRDGRAVVVSAAHPIWAGNEVFGAVVVEETTNPILSLRSLALERLAVLTLAAFALAAGVLLWFATRISARIRRLRDEVEAAIDARGRATRALTASQPGDEIGDLSRGFSTVLARLQGYNAYLEALAGRLSHELRTPIAVVRSSLENLRATATPEETQTYLARAEDGLARLQMILARMTEASRLEQSLSATERESYDAVPVVRGCVEGYRSVYPAQHFELELPAQPVRVEGAPDLLAQLLDKLVENAVDFSAAGEPLRVSLSVEGDAAVLSVENRGPALPEEIRERLFDSMITVRDPRAGAGPHLGLGLYVARLIAEFHGGTIRAENVAGGVRVAATLPRTL
jgi:dedicated sortase system histidine kinase